MTPLMMTLRAAFIAGVGAMFFMLAPATANAAHWGHGAHSGGIMVSGAVALYDDEDDDDDDDADDDDGSLFVDVEDCEPGKYWMMETYDDEGDVDFDTPMACH